MKIVFEHSGILPVKLYGGTERIIYWLMKELVKLGHEVCLIGHPDSEVEDIGVKLIPNEEDQNWKLKIPHGTDVIHTFYSTDQEEIGIPTLVTIEGNGRPGEEFPKNTVFVSKKHALNHGSEHFVYNGLDLDEYPFDPSKKKLEWNNFAFLAKASWKVKNVNDCIKACKKNKRHLHIAGGRKWTLNPYIHSYGMIGQDKKIPLLQKCDALLFPVRWHEPFGIAVIEAMALGCPVIGSAYGSLPELISECSGRVVNNYKELEDVVGQLGNIFNPIEIRNYVETKFSSSQMALKYIEYYNKIISGQWVNEKRPKAQFVKPAESPLDF